MSEPLVRYKAHELPAADDSERARRVEEMTKPDSDIDTTDISPWTDEQLRQAVRGRFYRPVKSQITAMIDQDVLTWLKSGGRGYQTRLNAILRKEMLLALIKAK